mmetsp:Transcript_16411/g.31370  ORF Transcript_16411/g.31370 Transcript_16411/m.31370 type:complete len:903 (+) Transcript_16411:313-3021(+)
MMGSSCSTQRRRRHRDGDHRHNPRSSSSSRRNRSGSGRNGEVCSPSSSRRGFKMVRSYSSSVGRLCGMSESDSSDEESTVKGPTKRFARHSVDAQIPDQSISNLYPPDDNYEPHPTNPTLRCPKSLTDLCIDAICRSLPNLDGELPPGLPKEIVDKIAASLTSHSALNCTTLRILKNCELGELNLAKCRGVSDDWLIPLSSSSCSSGSRNCRGRSCSLGTSPLGSSVIGARCPPNDTGMGDNDQRPRSYSCTHSPSGLPLSGIHHPAQFVLSPLHSSSFSEVQSSSPTMMELDDVGCDEKSHDEYQRNSDAINGDAMDDCCTKSLASRSTSSFVSAKSTLQSPGVSDHRRAPSPLFPSVLPPPEFFSMKLQGTPSSLWLYPIHHDNSSDDIDKTAQGISPLPSKKTPTLLPSLSSVQTEDSFTRGLYNHQEMSFSEGSYNHYDNQHVPPSSPGGISSSLTLLDLRGSHRLTDRGLLQLSRTPLCNLEIAKLDNCHGITGRGLVALSKSQKLRTLSLANCRRLTDEAVVNVSHLDSLEAVNLGGCRCLTDRSLEALSELVELRKLDLSQCDLITDEGLENLHNLEHIDELSLGWCRQITDDGLAILAKQPGRSNTLRVLCLARCPVSNKGLESIGLLTSVEQLDLNGCTRIGSSELGDTLKKLTKLTSLDVSYCQGILRSSWQGKIDNLKSLELCYAGVRDSHISRLRSLPKLEELNLDSCLIGDWAIAHLADNNVVPNLTALDLSDADISDRGVAKIAQFRNLKRLSLFYCNVSNAGLRQLSTITTLEELNLDSRDIDDNGLRYLRNLPLKSLDLFSNRVTDLGCAYISKIKTLTSLELCGGGVGDLGCAHLATLSNLTSLNLSQNEEITNRGAASIAVLSNLKALNLSKTRVDSGGLLRNS